MKSPLSKLKANPRNPRLAWTDAQAKSFAKSLVEFGDLSGIIQSKRTGNLIGGNKRTEQFRLDLKARVTITERLRVPDATGTLAWGYVETGGTRFGYRLVNWPAEKEAAANLAANQWGAEWDMDEVGRIIKELEGKIDLDLTGFDSIELNVAKTDLRPVTFEKPPEMTWVLIGIRTTRFAEISDLVEQIAARDVLMETTCNDPKD